MTLFDKSFLQAITPDEAAIFDASYATNITPLFFVETLGDLELEVGKGRSAEQVVGCLAYKTPTLHSYLNIPHSTLALGDLLGYRVEMRELPAVGPGRTVNVRGKTGIAYDLPTEMLAFERWQRHDFLGLERDFAKAFRAALAGAPTELARLLGSDGRAIPFASLAAIKAFATDVVRADGKRWAVLKTAMLQMNIPVEAREQILVRWKKSGMPALTVFAPYVAHLLTVDVFMAAALASGHISVARPSNRIDLAYLYYLPFTQLFVSGDKLHERTVPLFSNDRQTFVRSDEMKSDLQRLDAYYSQYATQIEQEGLMNIAGDPPLSGDFLICRLHDRFRPG